MIKILIDNEEVVSDSTLQIKEEMLSTSSTILKNCYPKAWEDTKDYNSNYYFPKDYSKCKIIQEEEIDFEILGETTQEGTPTPDSPKPIINKTGTITETIGGLPYQFNLGDIELCKIGNYQDKIYKTKGINLFNSSIISNSKITTSEDGTLNVSNVGGANGYCETGKTLSQLCPDLKVGDIVYLYIDTDFYYSGSKRDLIYCRGNWTNGTSKTITQDMLNGIVVIYGGYQTTSHIKIMITTTQDTSYEPYGSIGEWYLEKQIGKVVLNGSENWSTAGSNDITARFYTNSLTNNGAKQGLSSYFRHIGYLQASNTNEGFSLTTYSTYCYININKSRLSEVSSNGIKTWLSTHNTEVLYALATPTYEQITDPTLLEQLNNVGEILVFCGCVKNTGNISLNPRDPHYVDLQILDFKTLLSEGETLNYVITDKTIVEAINQVVSSISDYGFVVGNIELLTPNDKINAYSTLNKTAYDVFQYIADITQSKWTTRMIDENTIAIDFYDPTLMPQASPIESTQNYFEQNEIEDISFNYSTNDYRNKQIMTSDEVFANITQTETLIADGYRDSFMCQNKIGIIEKITVNGVEKTFATKSEEELGVSADFIYQPGEMTFNANTTYSAGVVIVITYYAIVKGREIILNTTESTRVSNQIGRKGTISRYENRNDTTSSQELIKIGQSYIKYKGSAEITLKVISGKDLFEVGQIVNYDEPLEELSTDYMVKSKVIDMYLNAGEIFYTYELSSNFNSENAINYFDNQRAKNQGNIGEGETITRNIDLESTALIQFYDTNVEEIVVSNPTSLDFGLDGVLI